MEKEKIVVGLDIGTTKICAIVGRKNEYGKLEIVQYEGVKSNNLYPRTKPPARGMLSITYIVGDLGPLLARGATLGIVNHGTVSSVLGAGRMASLTSPAGVRVDLLEIKH